ncbi:MAG: hypothetical protein U1E51_24280, partial [Candidatus Binatia bacterium]|nr:hypothetical protein [Candidatus Binatia bacterium]
MMYDKTMPSSFENPFIRKPENLKPDQAEFLEKYAGASDEQLKKAGLSGAKGASSEASELESADNLKEAVSDEE